MFTEAGEFESRDLVGSLQFDEFEGGFWSLRLDAPIDDLGDHVVLADFTPPDGAADGVRVRIRGVARPDLVDFLMAGVRFEVAECELLGALG